MEHTIITIARETGSGGVDTAARLSEVLGIPFYDRALLRLASDVSGIHEGLFGRADERVGRRELMLAAQKVYTGELLPPDSDDFTSTQNLFSFQAGIIRELADGGSCILVGRCADYLLAGRTDVLRVFLHAPLEWRKARVAAYSLAWTERDVLRHIRTEDKRRAEYYHHFTGGDWRDAANFDISLNSGALGIEGCAEMIRKAVPLFVR